MKKKNRLIIFIIMIFIYLINISGCSMSNNEYKEEIRNKQATIEDLNSKLDAVKEKEALLKSQIEQLRKNSGESQKKAEIYKVEHEYFPFITNMALKFVRAQTKGDVSVIEEIIAGKLNLIEDNGDIKIYKTINGNRQEWMIYEKNSKLIYKDMVIQGYEYDAEQDIFKLYIRQFYINNDDSVNEPPVFLNLSFAKQEDVFKIIDLEFDV
ncbi:hypothetical protein [Abyssisolibacter fermentans]|uniref:hypothetical protein n=1 Tax=Abyssisolibacter fermentans TaxID=1766203 RepID=UPI00082A0C25|nr:hypothetical protein [Abyssisolibacter fermentans]